MLLASRPSHPHALTIVRQRGLDFSILSQLASVVEEQFGCRIDDVTSLAATDEELECLELRASVPADVDAISLRRTLLALGARAGADVALQRDGEERRAKRLVVFDMDSTLIQGECIGEWDGGRFTSAHGGRPWTCPRIRH